MTALIELMLLEFFELRMVQTDPNFSNYQYKPDTGEIVLLDFGATRRFKASFVKDYKRLARAAIAGDRVKLVAASERLGYSMGEAGSDYQNMVLQFLTLALEPLRLDIDYDFAHSDMAHNISKLGGEVASFKDSWQVPPSAAVYFHRKVGGMFMLASRLKARVNVYQLMQRWLV